MSNDPRPNVPELARFLQDWSSLWCEELAAQACDPATLTSVLEFWQAMSAFKNAPPAPDIDRSPSRNPAEARTAAFVPAFDPRDAAFERLVRRVDELEGQVAELLAAQRKPRRR